MAWDPVFLFLLFVSCQLVRLLANENVIFAIAV